MADTHLAEIESVAKDIQFEPPNTLFIVMSNDEAAAP